MSKSSKIRWRKSDTEQLSRKVKNFNAKISRLSKSHPELLDVLPERVTARELKSMVTNRKEYNRMMKALSAFTEKGAETVVTGSSGARTTQWELNQVKKAVQAENRRRKAEKQRLENTPVYIGGKKYTDVRRMAGRQAMQPLSIRLDTRSQTSWDNFAKYMESQMFGGGQADEQRYLQMCIDCWSGSCSAAQVAILKDSMQRVGIGKCLKAYYNGVDELRPDFIYDAIYTQGKTPSQVFTDILNAINKIGNLPELSPDRFKGHYNRGVKLSPRNKYTSGE